LEQLVDWLTVLPSKTFGLNNGTLEIGQDADITLLNLNLEKEIDPEYFASKGKNTPFGGWDCKGWPAATFVNGELIWSEGNEGQ